jgi:hypothetical protein
MRYGYRHTAGVLIVLLVFIIGSITAAYGQVITGSPNTPSGYAIDYQTGNLITNGALTSGTGITTTNGAPTWTAYPSPQGSFGADGYTFSYPTESLGWAGINLSGINHGYLNSSAVFVTGFSYGLTYRFPCANSIGTNCDGNSQTAAPANPIQDNLRVEIGYYPSTGSASFVTHQLGLKNINDGNPAYNPNWQTLAETYTFAAAKPLAQAGSVNMEIIGSDAGGWACIGSDCYGPQVKNAYLRANYSVDPCILNPAFNPNCAGFNQIIQNWSSPTFYYSYNIAQSLPHIGGGVMLHGYDYGFNWWNYGACYNSFLFWCTDWRTDGGGNINFRVSDGSNATVTSGQWYVSGNNSGGSYSNRVLFTESRNSLNMGSVQWWTSDVWNHFAWYGWTRPIWTPDACYSQPLYSPNCSNFQAEINRIAAELQKTQQASVANVTASSTAPTPTGSVTTSITDAVSTNPTVTVTTNMSPVSAMVSTKSSSSTEQSTNLALSIISNNQRRETAVAAQTSQAAIALGAAAADAGQQQAMAIAQTAAAQSSQSASAETAITTASGATRTDPAASIGVQINPVQARIQDLSVAAATNAMVIVQPVVINQTNRDTQPAGSSMNPVTSTTAIVQFNAMTESAAQPGPVATAAVPLLAPVAATSSVSSSVQTYVPPAQTQATDAKFGGNNSQQEQFTARSEVQIGIIPPPATQTTEITASVSFPSAITVTPAVVSVDIPAAMTNFATDRTNPVNEIIQGTVPSQEPERNTAQTAAVKSNVQDNDAAAGAPTIASLAVVPVGFSVYSVALADAAFYAPKEIYRNQRTVDNLRALRQLSSDSLHQQMVDQQYRRDP